MNHSQQSPLKQFKLKRILWAAFIGLLGTIGMLVYQDMMATDGGVRAAISKVHWTVYSFAWILLGIGLMFLRDLFYTWRMRILTDKKLNWKNAWQVTLLWEFSSALTPSVVGGSAVAIYMLAKEKISAGKGTAIVFTTVLLDELFYLIMLPLVIFSIGYDEIFAPFRNMSEGAAVFSTSGFWLAYGVIAVYTLFLIFALFVNPKGSHRVIKRLFLTRPLKRWKRKGFAQANELLQSSREFRKKSLSFWLLAWTSTVLAWGARYLILNCILAAFSIVGLSFFDHVVAFARQAIMFIAMIVSPTPGSSGVAEFVFTELMGDLTPLGLGIALAALWRLITYYPYFIIGPAILPHWVKRVFKQEPQPIDLEQEVKESVEKKEERVPELV